MKEDANAVGSREMTNARAQKMKGKKTRNKGGQMRACVRRLSLCDE